MSRNDRANGAADHGAAHAEAERRLKALAEFTGHSPAQSHGAATDGNGTADPDETTARYDVPTIPGEPARGARCRRETV